MQLSNLLFGGHPLHTHNVYVHAVVLQRIESCLRAFKAARWAHLAIAKKKMARWPVSNIIQLASLIKPYTRIPSVIQLASKAVNFIKSQATAQDQLAALP